MPKPFRLPWIVPVLAIVFLSFTGLAFGQSIIFVDDDNCPGPGSGTEADPFCKIQDGIDAASESDTVLVLPGTYNEVINFDGKGIALRSRDGVNVTTIDGSGLNDSVVKCISGETPYTILDGFTITGGWGNLVDNGWVGGGMLNSASSPTVTNCMFMTNMQSTPGLGGGMYNSDNSNPTVTNCVFSENSANWGGGMYNDHSEPTVADCTFSGNIVFGDGGGIYNFRSNVSLTNSTITGNSASTGGGGIYNDYSSPTVTGCTFAENDADTGGGMYNDQSDPTVTNCIFANNDSPYRFGGGMTNMNASPSVIGCTFSTNWAAFGGGIANLEGSDPIVTDCTFVGNTGYSVGGAMYNDSTSSPLVSFSGFSTNAASGGGGIYNGGGNGSPVISNCTFDANNADEGGGIFNDSTSGPTIASCLFNGNAADSHGGGLFNRSGSPLVSNCTFYGNTADCGGGMYNESGSPSVISCIFWGQIGPSLGGSAIVVMYSDVQGGVDGVGNINANPGFVDAAAGNFRLSNGSPCIDAGMSIVVLPGLDLDRNQRPHDDLGTLDTGLGVPPSDMGAYEFDSSPPHEMPGDFDEDNDVDLYDFSEFVNHYTGPGG